MKGTEAPSLIAISAILGSSVDTMMSENKLL